MPEALADEPPPVSLSAVSDSAPRESYDTRVIVTEAEVRGADAGGEEGALEAGGGDRSGRVVAAAGGRHDHDGERREREERQRKLHPGVHLAERSARTPASSSHGPRMWSYSDAPRGGQP